MYIFSFWKESILEMGRSGSRGNGQEAFTRGAI